MGSVTPGEASFDARMAMVGEAVLVRHHADDFVPFDFGLERASHPAIAASSDYGAVGATPFQQALFHQGVGRAGLNAGAARDAFGIDIVLMLPGGHQRVEPA